MGKGSKLIKTSPVSYIDKELNMLGRKNEKEIVVLMIFGGLKSPNTIYYSNTRFFYTGRNGRWQYMLLESITIRLHLFRGTFPGFFKMGKVCKECLSLFIPCGFISMQLTATKNREIHNCWADKRRSPSRIEGLDSFLYFERDVAIRSVVDWFSIKSTLTIILQSRWSSNSQNFFSGCQTIGYHD